MLLSGYCYRNEIRIQEQFYRGRSIICIRELSSIYVITAIEIRMTQTSNTSHVTRDKKILFDGSGQLKVHV